MRREKALSRFIEELMQRFPPWMAILYACLFALCGVVLLFVAVFFIIAAIGDYRNKLILRRRRHRRMRRALAK